MATSLFALNVFFALANGGAWHLARQPINLFSGLFNLGTAFLLVPAVFA